MNVHGFIGASWCHLGPSWAILGYLGAIAGDFGVSISITPPHVGKWLSGVEVLWSVLKRRYRGTPVSQRGTPAACIALARRIGQGLQQERTPSLVAALPAILAMVHGRAGCYVFQQALVAQGQAHIAPGVA